MWVALVYIDGVGVLRTVVKFILRCTLYGFPLSFLVVLSPPDQHQVQGVYCSILELVQ